MADTDNDAPKTPKAKDPKPATTRPAPVLVWNTKRGVRQVAASVRAGEDASGMPRHNLVQVQFYPGLNLVDDHHDLVMPGVAQTDGLQALPKGLDDLPLATAKLAIADTGLAHVLQHLARGTDDPKLLDALEAQLALVARLGPTGGKARQLQTTHARRI